MSKRRDFWIKIMMVIPQLEHSNHACENCGIIAITRMAWGIPPLQSVVLRDITGNDVTCNSSVQLMQSGWLRWFLLSLAKVARIRGFRIYSYSSYHTYSPVCMSKLILFSFQRDPTLTTAFADSEWMIHSHSLIQSNHCSFIFSCTVDCIVVRGDRIAITFLQSLKIRVRLAICFRDLMSLSFTAGQFLRQPVQKCGFVDEGAVTRTLASNEGCPISTSESVSLHFLHQFMRQCICKKVGCN